MIRQRTQSSEFQYELFVLMYGIFIGIHHTISVRSWTHIGVEWLNPSHPVFLICGILTAAGVIWTILQPRERLPFLLTLIFWSALKLDNLPYVPNHIILALIVNFALIFFILYTYVKKVDHRKTFSAVRPYLQLCLIIVYFFSVFHKLNHDYFNPQVSCAAELYDTISTTYTVFPEGRTIDWIVIAGTLLIEAAIPILLTFRSARIYGILLALVFHTLLSLHTNVFIMSFSAEVFAMLILFLPEKALMEIKHGLSATRNGIRMADFRIKIITVLVFTSLLLYVGWYDGNMLPFLKTAFTVLWILWCLGLIAFTIHMLRVGHGTDQLPQKQKLHAFFIFPVIVFLNGLTPYFGIKTATYFAMFSILRTEGSSSNHLIIQKNYPLIGYSADLVEIVDSSDPYLQRIRDHHDRITRFELERWLFEHKDHPVKVAFADMSGIHSFTGPHEYESSYSWLARKFLIYRNLPPDGPCPCQW